MKKLMALTAALAASLFVLAPAPAEAGSYRSKVIGKCGGCGGHIHSFYRPVRLPCGNIRYTWVPSYHQTCGNRVSSYHSVRRVPSSRYVTRGYVPRTHGFTSRRYISRGPSFSIHFGGSRGFCR